MNTSSPFKFNIGDIVKITYFRKHKGIPGVVLGCYRENEINETIKNSHGSKECSVFNESNLYLVTYVHPNNSPALNDDGDNDGGERGYDVFSEKYLESSN